MIGKHFDVGGPVADAPPGHGVGQTPARPVDVYDSGTGCARNALIRMHLQPRPRQAMKGEDNRTLRIPPLAPAKVTAIRQAVTPVFHGQ